MNLRVVGNTTIASIGLLVVWSNLVCRFKYRPSRKDLIGNRVVLLLRRCWFWRLGLN